MDWTANHDLAKWQDDRYDVDWFYGHSYHYVVGKKGVQFTCWDCGEDLKLGYGSGIEHCWDCKAKFCAKCWGLSGYAHISKHHSEEPMAKQQKQAVTVTRKQIVLHYAYKNQWHVSGSAASPYIVSEAKDGNWSCSCMAWTRNHPREDCKHIMRVKLSEAVPAEVKVEPSMQFVQATGRKFR